MSILRCRRPLVEPFELAQDIFAVLEKILGELVERGLGGQRLKLLRAVPFGVFKEGHRKQTPQLASFSQNDKPLADREIRSGYRPSKDRRCLTERPLDTTISTGRNGRNLTHPRLAIITRRKRKQRRRRRRANHPPGQQRVSTSRHQPPKTPRPIRQTFACVFPQAAVSSFQAKHGHCLYHAPHARPTL